MQLDADRRREARGLRGPARRRHAGLARRHSRPSSVRRPCARSRRNTTSEFAASGGAPAKQAGANDARSRRCVAARHAAVRVRARDAGAFVGARDDHGGDGAARDLARRIHLAVGRDERQAARDHRRPASAVARRLRRRSERASLCAARVSRARWRSKASARPTPPCWCASSGSTGSSASTRSRNRSRRCSCSVRRKTSAGRGEIASAYLVLGVEHILGGIDHLLFVFSLLFLVGFQRKLVWTITAFTAAHSLTLASAALGMLVLRPPPVEATIALSIVLVAAEALHKRDTLARAVTPRCSRSCSVSCTDWDLPARSRKSACRRTTCRRRCSRSTSASRSGSS